MKQILCFAAMCAALGLCANSFESQKDFEGIKGKVSQEKNIYCYGKHSLRWEAAPGATLELPLPLKDSPRREFSFFIYSSKVYPHSTITMKVGNTRLNRTYSGSFPINFLDWRTIRVAPREDWEAQKDKGIRDVLELTWNGKEPAVFCIDVFKPRSSWMRSPSELMPSLNPRRTAFHTDVKPPLIIEKIRAERMRWLKAPAPTQEEKKSLDLVRKRMKFWFTSYDLGHPVLTKAYQKQLQNQAKEAWKTYQKLNIRREGKYLHFDSLPAPDAGFDYARRNLIHKTIAPLSRLYAIPFKGNTYYKKPEVGKALVDMIDMMLYQGLTYGSDQDWPIILQIRELGQIAFLMQDELREAGLLGKLQWSVIWNGRLLAYAPLTRQEAAPGADILRSALPEAFAAALTLPDNVANAALHALKKVISDQLVVTGGTTDLIKPDGTLFHHGQVANSAYGPDGLYGGILMANMLNHTVYAPDDSIYGAIRHAIINLDRQHNNLDTPAATNVRWAFATNTAIALPAIAACWLDIHPDDKEIGAIFRRVYQNPEKLRRPLQTCCPFDNAPGEFMAMERAAKRTAKLSIAKSQEGNFLYSYSAFQIHRRDNWMIAARGFGKHAWAYETGSFKASGYENKLARFVSHGPLQIFAEGKDAVQSGFVDKGWDPLHFPGTTAPAIPLDELVLPRDPYKYGRNYTPARLAGGGNIQGQDGAFGLELIDPAIKGFRAFKSYHFCGDTVVALGSGITSPRNDVEVHTTIYQNYTGKAKGSEGAAKTSQDAAVLTDCNGTRYYIPAQSSLVTREGTQTAPNYYGQGSHSGEYQVAWINHGTMPQDGKYEYALRVAPKDDAAPDYQVLALTPGVHAVYFPGAKLYSAAVLETAEELPEGFPLRKVSRPGIYLARELDNGKMLFSFTDTDFLPNETEAHPPHRDILSLGRDVYPAEVTITAELRDNWRNASGNAILTEQTIAVPVKPGFSTEITLEK